MKTFNNAVVYINLDKFEKNLPPVGSHSSSSFFFLSLYGSISFLDLYVGMSVVKSVLMAGGSCVLLAQSELSPDHNVVQAP